MSMTCKRFTLGSIWMALLIAAAPPVIGQNTGAAADEKGPATGAHPCRPLTLASGEQSGWGGDGYDFEGEDLVIRDQTTFEEFWAQHTSFVTPPPDHPHIDFRHQVVLAAIQGSQTSGGGPSITIVSIRPMRNHTDFDARRPVVVVRVVDDRRPGPLDVITNPFHIVIVPKKCVPPKAHVRFRHVPPRPGTGIIRGTVWAPANAALWRGLPWGWVRLRGEDGRLRRAQTGWDGSYTFLNLRPGAYEVDANNPPYITEPQIVQLEADQVYGLDFYLEAGPPAETIDGQ